MYKCRRSNIEFELRYAESRIKEIKEELKELKDNSDSGSDSDDDVETKTKELKGELKKTRVPKKESFRNWNIVCDADEERRTQLDIQMNIALRKESISGDSFLTGNNVSVSMEGVTDSSTIELTTPRKRKESESIPKHDLMIPRNISCDTTQENGTVGVQ